MLNHGYPGIYNSSSLEDVVNYLFVFLLHRKTMDQDLFIIDDIVDKRRQKKDIIKDKLIILKSTVIPWTTESYCRKYCELIKFIYSFG